jgi:hypothetical protein
MKGFTVAAMTPEDEPALTKIMRDNGQVLAISPGAFGTVVRFTEHPWGERVVGFCLIRERPVGFVVDELWSEHSRAGVASIGLLFDWFDETMQRVATERGQRVSLGGIVRLDNELHMRALEKRGCAFVAKVLVKEYDPRG